MRSILPPAPADLVDFLFNLERLQVVELGLVRLELGVEAVLAPLLLAIRTIVALEHHHTTALVTGGEVIASRIELNGRDDVGLGDVVDIALVTKALRKTPRHGRRAGSRIVSLHGCARSSVRSVQRATARKRSRTASRLRKANAKRTGHSRKSHPITHGS